LTGAWLDSPPSLRDANGDTMELAFVPFSLGSGAKPIGCLVYGQRFHEASPPLSHRLADLIDATDLIVTVLRPAIEHAETTNAAIANLKTMISRRKFVIHLQPIVEMYSGAVVAVEALTRFADGVRPDLRFAEAAGLGLGAALQRATVAAAIESAAPLPPEVQLSVNISPDVLEHDTELAEIIRRAQRPMIVELTEHERIDDYDAVRSAFARLGPNVRLAVDDAGSGYASLRHILSLKPAYVKLDIEWVRGIGGDPIRRSLVSGLAYFAAETGCELIAEGIEQEEERQALIELGVRLGQGFLLGRPEPGPGASEAPSSSLPAR
jgi:EAL domain-containing protein (putative c-di-GMP-specific phosphodiesterase class I)